MLTGISLKLTLLYPNWGENWKLHFLSKYIYFLLNSSEAESGGRGIEKYGLWAAVTYLWALGWQDRNCLPRETHPPSVQSWHQ